MPPTPTANPRISSILVGVTWLEVAVLAVAGGGLLIASPTIAGIWPWALAPFHLRFLGAIYTAALFAALLQCLYARWSPARTVTAMIFVFTLVVTACSFVHLTRFDFAGVPAWIWFGLYLGVCLNAGAHLVWYRQVVPAGAMPPPGARLLFLAQALVLGAYGIALLSAPAWASVPWPWKIDAFHAQLYSVVFLTPAVGGLCLRRAATRADWLTLGITQVTWGALPIVALWLVDKNVHRVDWHAAGTWAWLALFAAIAAMGVWMLARAAAADGTRDTQETT